MHRIPSIVLVIALTILTIHSSPAAEFTVTTVTELQNALTTAASNGEDDIITVATGTYEVTTPLHYSSNNDGGLEIVAQNFRALPLFDGQGMNQNIPILVIYDNSSDNGNSARGITVKGIVFRHGSHGGLTVNTNAVSISISSCLFMDNNSGTVAGAHLITNTGAITANNNTFFANQSNYYGAGLNVSTTEGTVRISANHFSDNIARVGGGLYISGGDSDIFLTRNTFSNNTAEGTNGQAIHGGGVGLSAPNGSVHVNGNLFIGNQAGDSSNFGFGGGMDLVAQEVEISNNYLADNRATVGGGIDGTVQPASSITQWRITNNTLSHNHATGSFGGGIMIESYNDLNEITITNNIIRDNSSGGATGDDLRIITDMDGNGTGSTVNLNYNLLGPNTNFASGHSDDLYITNTDHYHHHDNGTDDPRLRDDGHLPSGSPAINRGICGMWIIDPLHGNRIYYRIAPLTDRDGDPRPGNGATGGCDIGADEYHFPWPMFLPAIVRPHLNPFSIPTHPGF